MPWMAMRSCLPSRHLEVAKQDGADWFLLAASVECFGSVACWAIIDGRDATSPVSNVAIILRLFFTLDSVAAGWGLVRGGFVRVV